MIRFILGSSLVRVASGCLLFIALVAGFLFSLDGLVNG